ncbi:uncharacterized protein LOC111315481 [Durio zibethinus]|uniref:Uncharacterized protein LOC111315481 n=1 Tax=Durio zibethinus TaxID=66656 RepID=A0A6P6B6Z4_DURZI|nr:uncharacterized protein LOC111315481 [Durio zibethinus]
MALLASSVLPSALNIKVKRFEHEPSSQLHGFLLQLNCHRRVSPKCGMKITTARFQFGEPNKIKEQLNFIKERLWEKTPDAVKDFPWKKAENLLLQRLLFVGKKALKLSVVTFFVLSCLSDFIYSISRNQELIIPFGLIVGCLMTDFLKETSQEAFRSFEGKGLKMKWLLMAMGGFFAVVKFVSTYFAMRTRVFLLHVANGGLMQVLWLWRSLLEENGGRDGGNLFSMQD